MSELRANTISNAAGTGPVTLTGQSAAKAWVNFNGTGTIAARDSFNLSGLTDNGTGDYTISFNNSFGAAEYVPCCGAAVTKTSARGSAITGVRATTFEADNPQAAGSLSTGSCIIESVTSSATNNGASARDIDGIYPIFLGDLA